MQQTERRTRVLVVIWDFFGGGAERVAVLLANALKACGAEVAIVASRPEGPNRELLSPDIPLHFPPKPSAVHFVIYLRRLIGEFAPDVVLAHQTTRNVAAIIAHRLAPGRDGRVVVGVEHGQMEFTRAHTRGLSLRVYFLLARLLYPFADAIVSVSQNVQDSVARFIAPRRARLFVLPNPVLAPHLFVQRESPPEAPWLQAKAAPVFIGLGRLESQKNFALMIEAFATLRARVEARLIIFGEGSLRAELEAKVKALGLEEDVALPGFTTNPFAALKAADALVLSSVWEGLPTVAIEALACGAQVVSTDNSAGVRDILENGAVGFIVPNGDAGALAAAMERALLDPVSPERLRRAAARFESNHVAALYLDLFAALRAGPP